MTGVTGPKGNVTRYEYDANGNLSAVIDAQGKRTRMTYDAVNRLKYLVDPRADAANIATTPKTN